MAISKCRVCNHMLFSKPLLEYKNMPKAAQYLPDAKTLKYDRGTTLKVFQCSGCGLVQLNNNPVPYHKEVIRAAAFSPEMKKFRIKQFKDFVQKFALKNKKLIEIGCGCGEYLALIEQAGVKAFGLEYSAKSVQQCLKIGLNVSKGFIEHKNYKLKNAPFDAFMILNFLEHLPDPDAVLSGICNNLKDNAVGLVEVPNFDMILKNKLFSEFINDHLFYFTEDTLSTTLKLNGFDILECNVIWHNYIISAVVRKRQKLDLSEFHRHQAKITQQITRYIRRFGHRKVAIWGAGHQALAVIALANLANRVKYIIDSATFKQGKYTPATHIPIVSPNTLDLDPPQAIIVMAASYSDEVAKIIKKRFDKNIKVYILRDSGLQII